MLNRLNLILIEILPYYIIVVFFGLISGYLIDNGMLVLQSMGILLALSLATSIASLLYNIIKKSNAEAILRNNRMLKTIHIPAYLILFMFGLASTITIFTIGLSVVILILDIIMILLSGMVGLSGIIRSLDEKKLTRKGALLHGILQFIFCLDILSAFVVYRKVCTKL